MYEVFGILLKITKSTFIKIAVSFTSLIPCLSSPTDDREKTERTPTQLLASPKCYFLRLLPNKVALLPKKVVSLPKKVDCFPEIVAYPPNKKSPQKAIFLAHLKKKVYLCTQICIYIKSMPNTTPKIVSFEDTLSAFFAAITTDAAPLATQSPILQAIISIYCQQPLEDICQFALDDESASVAINQLKKNLQTCAPEQVKPLNSPLTYLLDELICNIQQHAQTDKGYAYLHHNAEQHCIDIAIADLGITIYGSYVAAQKHLDRLGDSDAEALNLAQNGYSVKNLPDTENRGYGISSNMRMVVKGLGGEFAVLSGNALLLYSQDTKKILSLPSEIDFKGTMIIVRIPDQVPNNFNLYTYTS